MVRVDKGGTVKEGVAPEKTGRGKKRQGYGMTHEVRDMKRILWSGNDKEREMKGKCSDRKGQGLQ
jgi:hypothetical protein